MGAKHIFSTEQRKTLRYKGNWSSQIQYCLHMAKKKKKPESWGRHNLASVWPHNLSAYFYRLVQLPESRLQKYFWQQDPKFQKIIIIIGREKTPKKPVQKCAVGDLHTLTLKLRSHRNFLTSWTQLSHWDFPATPQRPQLFETDWARVSNLFRKEGCTVSLRRWGYPRIPEGKRDQTISP